MAPIWTPLIFESIDANADSGTRASAQDAGRAVRASFPNSRRERSIPRLLRRQERKDRQGRKAHDQHVFACLRSLRSTRRRCYIKALGDRVGLFVPERDERIDPRGTASG